MTAEKRGKKRRVFYMLLCVFIAIIITSTSVYSFSIDKYINKTNYFSNYLEISAIIKLKNSTKENLKDRIKETKAMQIGAVNVLNADFRKKQQLTMINVITGNLTRDGIEKLRNYSDVEEIYYDTEFRIAEFEDQRNYSIALDVGRVTIGANYSNFVLNLTGKNITVAVIDTGIEYNHTAFGSCTLTNVTQGNCRIKGGYDFVNNDNDPMDDNSHGTHVAGTVGGNGTVVGIAPEVNFYALKVCNSGGSCPTANIAAGIDWAIGNNANIITISIGGTSTPNLNDGYALLDELVDDAVSFGIVVTIAAGNDGPSTSIISSPGSARRVITVGASDDKGTFDTSDDTIASFSSRGPSAFGRLDPDLCAPGVSINAPVLNNAYGVKSGTSMATPGVAGAAALMLEYNRNFTPKKIRSRLMQASTSIPGSVFEEGAGMINVTKAILTTIEADINGSDRWEFSIIPGQNITTFITLVNNNSNSLSFNFSLNDVIDKDNSTSLNKTAFTLPQPTTINSNSNASFRIAFGAPANANATIYGTTLTITANNSENLHIPIVATIPLVDSGIIYGKFNNDGSFIYYKVKIINTTSTKINLSWNNSLNDLDLYVYTPNGVQIGVSGGTSNSEQVILSSFSYDEFWILVRAFSITPLVFFNITISSNSTMSINPSIYQTRLGSELTNITLEIQNNNAQKGNLTLKAKIVKQSANFSFNNATFSAGKNNTVLFLRDLGINLNETRFITINATWINASNDIDLYLRYWSDSNANGAVESTELADTRFSSQHYNYYENKSLESMNYVDIRHYIKNYNDIAFEIRNLNYTNSENVTVSGMIYNESSWERIALSPTIFNLTANEARNITVSINTTGLSKNQSYDFSLIITNSTNYEFINTIVRLSLNTAPNITSFQPNSSTFNIAANSTIQLNHTSTDIEGDAISYSWYVDGILNATTQSMNYTSHFQAGLHNITVAASDGQLNDSHTWTANITNSINRIPVASNVSILPQNATKTNNITCNYTYSDPDNNPDNRTIVRWYLNGSANLSFENSTAIFSANLSKNQVWICEVTPNDGTAFGASVNSSNTTILNALPIALNASITPQIVYKTTTNVTCNTSYSDADNDAENNSIARWYVNGNLLGFNSSVLNNSNYNRTNILMCEYIPKDGVSLGMGINSTNITVLNSLPSIFNIINATKNNASINASSKTCSYQIADQEYLNSTTAFETNFCWRLNLTLNISAPPNATITANNVQQNISENNSYAVAGFNFTILRVNTSAIRANITANSTIQTFEINETDNLAFSINTSDADADAVNYSINFSLITVQNNILSWTTNDSISGHYTFRINASDGLNASHFFIAVNVTNVPLLGNISNISTNFNNLSIVIDNSTSLENITNQKVVEFRQSNSTIVHFIFNFTAAVLNFSRIKIEKQANTSAVGSLVVRGLTLFGDQRKTVYLDNIANKSSVCIKDADIVNVSQISSACNSANEYFVPCNGTITSGYNCTANGSRYIVLNLSNSGIVEYAPFCGDGACNSDETCSSCSADCGACAVPSSGSGGGGGILAAPNATKNTTKNVTRNITSAPTNISKEAEKKENFTVGGEKISEIEAPKIVAMAVQEINQTAKPRERISWLTPTIILILVLAGIIWGYAYFRKMTSVE